MMIRLILKSPITSHLPHLWRLRWARQRCESRCPISNRRCVKYSGHFTGQVKPGIYTIGPEFNVPPPPENPLVIAIEIETREIPLVTKPLYEYLSLLIRRTFDRPVPPFRFYVKSMDTRM